MSQYNYSERVYQNLESLYKENRKDNLVTLDDFKHNYLEKGLSIEQALIFRDLTENEKEKNKLKSYSDSSFVSSIFCFFISIFLFKTEFWSLAFSNALNNILFENEKVFIVSIIWLIMASLPLIIAGKSIFDLLIPFTPKGKIARYRLKNLEVIVAKEHQEIKNKIQEELKAI